MVCVTAERKWVGWEFAFGFSEGEESLHSLLDCCAVAMRGAAVLVISRVRRRRRCSILGPAEGRGEEGGREGGRGGRKEWRMRVRRARPRATTVGGDGGRRRRERRSSSCSFHLFLLPFLLFLFFP